mmetsp:Transcript_1653/g.6293  ORF Transcript_1653/g.6293 Transcript_1653/m.6293 type:complete len:92 (-) Transcript_1653:283-558(-)
MERSAKEGGRTWKGAGRDDGKGEIDPNRERMVRFRRPGFVDVGEENVTTRPRPASTWMDGRRGGYGTRKQSKQNGKKKGEKTRPRLNVPSA